MLGLDKDLYSRTTIYIPGLDNIRKIRCVLSLINPINKMYAMLASLKTRGSQEPVIAHLDQSCFQ